MADVRKMRVMISSRSITQVFGGTALGDVRQRLQDFLHAIRWHAAAIGPVGRDQPLFDVWIHENDAGRAANRTTLEMSLEEIDKADFVIALYTGESGSADRDADIGICHAELQQALARRSDIVAMVGVLPFKTNKLARDVAFRDYVSKLRVPRRDADSETQLHSLVAELLQQLVSVQVGRGASVGTRKRDRGQALDWNRLDLSQRRDAMRASLARHLQSELIGDDGQGNSLHVAQLGGARDVAVQLDAVAAAWSVAVARERVGQPFLGDHRHESTLVARDVPGVVHIVACHRAVTEGQATRMLGTPDAISVSSDFGVYVADHVQQIQMIFLAQCGDDDAVALAVRRLREWLDLPGPGVRLLDRARSRRNILEVVAQERRSMDAEPRAKPKQGKR